MLCDVAPPPTPLVDGLALDESTSVRRAEDISLSGTVPGIEAKCLDVSPDMFSVPMALAGRKVGQAIVTRVADTRHLVEYLKALKKTRELRLAPSKCGLPTTPPPSLPPFQPVRHWGVKGVIAPPDALRRGMKRETIENNEKNKQEVLTA